MTSAGARHLRARPEVLAGAGEVETEYAKDTWDAARLGVPARRGRNLARFGVIAQPWLREAMHKECAHAIAKMAAERPDRQPDFHCLPGA